MESSGAVVVSLGWSLIFENNAKDFAPQSFCQPGVFDDSQLQTLTMKDSIVVGVDRSAHAFNNDQVCVSLLHQHGQAFV